MGGLRGAKIAIFKAETDRQPDPYIEELEKCGFRPFLVPNITFAFFDLPVLQEKLKTPQKYSGLILSSERCVIAVQKAATVSDLGQWKEKIVVCAGEASAQKTRELLGLEPQLGEKHRAEGIIDLLANTHPSPTMMLYPCGELAANKDAMVAGLAKRGIGCESVPVYKTDNNPELKIILTRVFNEMEQQWPKICVFFSPSGFKSVLEGLENIENLNSCKLVAIGPTTSSAIKERGFPVWAEASSPNPVGLRIAIEENA